MLNGSKKHRVVGSFTTNTSVPGHESWNLSTYQTVEIGKPGGRWRLIEVGYNLLYAEGKIAADGKAMILAVAGENGEIGKF